VTALSGISMGSRGFGAFECASPIAPGIHARSPFFILLLLLYPLSFVLHLCCGMKRWWVAWHAACASA